MQQLIKIPEISATMRELSKEMMRVILIYFIYHRLQLSSLIFTHYV